MKLLAAIRAGRELRDVVRAARNVVGRQTVAGGGVAAYVVSDDPWVRRVALLALLANAVADFVIELRLRKAPSTSPARPDAQPPGE